MASDLIQEAGSQEIKITYQKDVFTYSLDAEATTYDLALHFAEAIQADVERVSFLVTPRPGLLKYPFPESKLSDLLTEKTRIKAIGTPTKDVQRLNETASKVAARRTARQQARQIKPQSTPNRDWKRVQEEAKYTFHSIEPLKYLPDPEKSRRFLHRLANDPGIKASMRKHKFSVGLLTEMNPAEHTTHESKTLGLNRNGGEVIELRLRTDAYDGYRDYKVIRKTLCHELAHNVVSDHNRQFYDLMALIEKEVEQNDWLHGGNKLSQEEFFDPEDEYEEADGGAWQGGEFVLGGVSNEQGMSRREIMARAAMARIEKQKELDENDPGSGASNSL